MQLAIGIVAAAFALRLASAVEMANFNGGLNTVFTPSKASDLATYMTLAQEICKGGFPAAFYYQPWYYAVFLPVILLTGAGVKAVIAAQIVCGTCAVIFAALTALLFAGKRGAVFTALLAATSVPLVFYTPFHQNETLQSMHLALMFLAALIALLKGKWQLFLAAGIVSGIAIATRGNITLIFGYLFILTLVFPRRIKAKKRLLNAAVLTAGAVLMVLPFSLHNTIALKRLCGPSTAGDAVLALGNTPEAPAGGRNPGLPAGPMEYPEAFHRTMSDTSHGVGLGKAMVNWMCREPLAFFELQIRKLLLFWDVREIPNNVSLEGEGRTSSVIGALRMTGFEYFLPICGLAGLLLAAACFKVRDVRLWWLAGFIVIYWGSIALFYNLSRFRAPVFPVLAVAAALLLRRRIKCRKIVKAAVLLFAFFVSVSLYDCYRLWEPQIMRVARPDGTLVPPAIGSRQYDLLDNGPFTFGAWSEVKLAPGTAVGKKFSHPGVGNVTWKLFSDAGNTITLKDKNGKLATFTLARGENNIILEDQNLSDNGFEVVFITGNVFAMRDFQRDYGRSTLDGRFFSAEWVARAGFTLDKKPIGNYTK